MIYTGFEYYTSNIVKSPHSALTECLFININVVYYYFTVYYFTVIFNLFASLPQFSIKVK